MGRSRISASGLFLTLLALVAQLALATAMPREQMIAALDGVTTICHDDGSSGAPPLAPHHSPDCQVCPLCVSPAPGVSLLPVNVIVPAPIGAVVVERVVLPPATAPPRFVTLAARPRGPPVSLT